MHANAFDRYHEAESRLHRLDPRVKVVLTILFILSNALLPDGAWAAFGLAWIFLLWVNQLSNLGVNFTFRRSLIALPFALAAVSAIFSPLGNPLAEWRLGSLTLIPTDYGLVIRQHPRPLVAVGAGRHFAGGRHTLPRHDPRLRAFARACGADYHRLVSLSLPVRADGRGDAPAPGERVAQCGRARFEVRAERGLASARHRQHGRSTLPEKLRAQ